ncbi:tetratricopeptide repeat protein [Candidatus Latescibacterota bacterium]
MVMWLVRLLFSTPVMAGRNIARMKYVIAFGAGLVFVSHPLQTQAVTYIVQRFASLATFFYLMSLCFYLNARLTRHAVMKGMSFLGALIAAVLGMLTKEIVLTLPVAVILVEFMFIQTGPVRAALRRRDVQGIIVMSFLAALILPALYSFDIIRQLHPIISEQTNDPILTLPVYVITQFRVLVTYLRLLFLPVGQNLDHDFPASRSLFEPATFLSLVGLVLLFVLAVRLYRTHRVLSFGIFWFFLTLSIESIRPLMNVMFEHRLYLPMFGFSLIISTLLFQFVGRRSLAAAFVVLGILVSCYSFATYQRNFVWKNEYSLWTDVIKKSPMKKRPYINLGNYFYEHGDIAQAEQLFKTAITLDPDHPVAYNNLGTIYAARDDMDAALEAFQTAVRLTPGYADAHFNIGNVYYYRKQYDEAIREYRLAVARDPDLVEAFHNLAAALYAHGDLDDAIATYRRTISLDPNLVEAHYHLGVALQKKGEFQNAAGEFEQVLLLDPENNTAQQRLYECVQGLSE